MQKRMQLAAIGVLGGLLTLTAVAPVGAQDSQPRVGTVGRIAKFVTTTGLGNSVLFENKGRIGLGTTAPIGALDIRSRNALTLMAARPYMSFRDTNTANAPAFIESRNGGLTFSGLTGFNGTNPTRLVHIDSAGRVGFGTRDPQRAIQIGPGIDPMFTIEPSDASPRAGFIRFGDKTGWQLRIGRSRESSRGPLNTGITGSLFTFRDDGAFGPTGYPLLATGVEPLCRTLANFITRCQASSLRYKTDIEPYRGGLDVVERLRPIAFTRILSGTHDIGLAAEDVAAIEPRLTFNNDDNEVEGIRYELLTTVLVNAVKEQQAQLDRQQEQIEALLAAVSRLEGESRRQTAD